MSKPEDAGAGPTPSFDEILLEGAPETARGLLAGLCLAGGGQERYYYGPDHGLARPAAGGRLRELIGRPAGACHIIAAVGLGEQLERHAARIEAQTGLRLASRRRIVSARFGFSYQAFARRYATEIRALLAELPAGAALAEHDERENVDERAAGVEAYSPVHDFEATGKGVVSGRIDAVIAARANLAGHPLIKVARIELETA